MTSVGVLPALALIAGSACGIGVERSLVPLVWLLPVLASGAIWGWLRARTGTTTLLTVAFYLAGVVLASAARHDALRPPLRQILHAHIGEFDIATLGPERDHDPIPARIHLEEDAAPRDGFVSLRADVMAVSIGGRWHDVRGGVSLSISGEAAFHRLNSWRAGRVIEAPITFRRPARYLNDGVPDHERDAAVGGTALFGTVKSGLLLDVVSRGSSLEEYAAGVRLHVRRVVRRWVGPHDPISAAVVTAVLIGDRTGLPLEVRDRLQAAGTYHVIAISGGNIAILAALTLAVLALAGTRDRLAAAIAIAVLLVYSEIATAGPSVWRATLMAVLYFGARLLDHRTAPWQAAGVAAAIMVVLHPLDVRDPGFILTFGATAALLEAARHARAYLPRSRVAAWLVASVVASLATEIALLPVSAQAFSRVTSAGLILNLIAVPMMGVAQVAGVVVALAPFDGLASTAGWVAYAAAHALVESSRLVDAAPWLTLRVPPPGVLLLTTYYGALVGAVWIKGARRPAIAVWLVAAGLIAGLRPPPFPRWAEPTPLLRLDVFDVGQSEAMLLHRGDESLLIDAGGAPFGNSSFDVGARVLMPALWARGVRSLGTLLITHGDPDHLGGAAAVADAFAPQRLWEGIDVPRHMPMRELREKVAARRARVESRRSGEVVEWSGARIRVLHPPPPEWERPRVRNDDSVVVDIVFGDVAILLTGDISSDIERDLVPQLSSSPIRILKVAHHGSRTSTSQALLDAWRPQYALISAGRGNTFGHPAPDVIRRLESIGAAIFRTDLHGQITVETDGRRVEVRTYVGRGED